MTEAQGRRDVSSRNGLPQYREQVISQIRDLFFATRRVRQGSPPVVHGIPGARRLARGDVVKLDVTAEIDGYMADAARTIIVGAGTPLSKRLQACVRAAFGAALRETIVITGTTPVVLTAA